MSEDLLRVQLGADHPHLIEHLERSLGEQDNSSGRRAFIAHLGQFDFARLGMAFKQAMHPRMPSGEGGGILPVPADQCVDREQLSEAQRNAFEQKGLKAVAEGRVGAIVLAGGQASRLGSAQPKGVLSLGIELLGAGDGSSPTTDSLLFIQAAQIARLQREARARFPAEAAQSAGGGRITWMVMTSRSTDAATRAHLDAVIDAAGLQREQVMVFVQAEIPAFDFDGRALLKSQTELVSAPDGNGGMYEAIRPLLPELEQRGVQLLNIYCVDNILCRVADPLVLGCAIERGADCVFKVIEKREPGELVGHVCMDGQGRVRVLEYSEIPAELAQKRDPDAPDKLFLRAGSIANHFVTLELLRDVCTHAEERELLPYHIARKRIPHWDPERADTVPAPAEPNGIKLERFIFDPFCIAKNVLLWQVPAAEEFSPLKNAEQAGHDCVSTCVRAFAQPHADWLRAACAQCVVQQQQQRQTEEK